MQSANAQDIPPELRGSGLPLPRFVSIGSDKAFVRTGPAPRYPIKWVYKKEGFPVEITQEFDVWRKVRDIAGDEGWINKALLSDKRSVVIRGDEPAAMIDKDEDGAVTIARLEPGVVAAVSTCGKTRCRLSAGGFSGWVERNILWGLYPQEEIQ